MSCSKATAPIDITKGGSSDCSLKCQFSFNYKYSGLRARNNGDNLKITFDKSTVSPVVYNTEKYDVQEMKIFQPSLHTYGGTKADGELIIMHNSQSSGKSLLVSIPISKGSTAGYLDGIITQASKKANTQGTTSTINMQAFTLDNIVPKKPFFSYQGTLAYSPCNGTYDYIVYGLDNSVNITLNSLTNLKKIISNSTSKIKPNNNRLSFNKKGASNIIGDSGDDIYIECNPTGADGKTLVDLEDTSKSSGNPEWANKLFSSGVLTIILIIIAFFVLMKLFNLVINLITNSATSSSSSSESSS
jgi:carbonic anhydrase|uniref:carbonic anhydrase n=1 Tax=viral metagenome TaxID=1070528 RepID=A0A6C0JGL3_9ZZZZ